MEHAQLPFSLKLAEGWPKYLARVFNVDDTFQVPAKGGW
jgi:hypothetical protein